MTVGSIRVSNYYQQGFKSTNKKSADSNIRERSMTTVSNKSVNEDNKVENRTQSSAVDAYRAASAYSINGIKPSYTTYESDNYRIVPDNGSACFDIYDKQGNHLGVFSYSDIKIRYDSESGKQLLISENGTASYDALILDEELKEILQNVMGIEELGVEELQGYQLKQHSGTGILYLVRDGEEGRGQRKN